MLVFRKISAIKMTAKISLLRCLWLLLISSFLLWNFYYIFLMLLHQLTCLWGQLWSMGSSGRLLGKETQTLVCAEIQSFSTVMLLPASELSMLPTPLCIFLMGGLMPASKFCLITITSLASAFRTKTTINSSMTWVSARLSDNLCKLLNQSHTRQWPDLMASSRTEILIKSQRCFSPNKMLYVCQCQQEMLCCVGFCSARLVYGYQEMRNQTFCVNIPWENAQDMGQVCVKVCVELIFLWQLKVSITPPGVLAVLESCSSWRYSLPGRVHAACCSPVLLNVFSDCVCVFFKLSLARGTTLSGADSLP